MAIPNDAVTVQKCCNKDEILDDRGNCVEPTDEGLLKFKRVNSPILSTSTKKRIEKVIKDKMRKFLNKHKSNTIAIHGTYNVNNFYATLTLIDD